MHCGIRGIFASLAQFETQSPLRKYISGHICFVRAKLMIPNLKQS